MILLYGNCQSLVILSVAMSNSEKERDRLSISPKLGAYSFLSFTLSPSLLLSFLLLSLLRGAFVCAVSVDWGKAISRLVDDDRPKRGPLVCFGRGSGTERRACSFATPPLPSGLARVAFKNNGPLQWPDQIENDCLRRTAQ